MRLVQVAEMRLVQVTEMRLVQVDEIGRGGGGGCNPKFGLNFFPYLLI